MSTILKPIQEAPDEILIGFANESVGYFSWNVYRHPEEIDIEASDYMPSTCVCIKIDTTLGSIMIYEQSRWQDLPVPFKISAFKWLSEQGYEIRNNISQEQESRTRIMNKKEQQFYIISYGDSDKFLTFWRKDNEGYTQDLNQAGLYDRETVEAHYSYYNDFKGQRLIQTAAVEKERVEQYMAFTCVLNNDMVREDRYTFIDEPEEETP